MTPMTDRDVICRACAGFLIAALLFLLLFGPRPLDQMPAAVQLMWPQ